MHTRTTLLATGLCSLLGSAGCPTEPDDDGSAFLLSGTVTSEFGDETVGSVGVALLWDLEPWGFLDQAKVVAEGTEVDGPFPADFELAASPPGEPALFTAEEAYLEPGDDPEVRIGLGHLLGYADGNGNGALDLLADGDMELVDLVIGVSAVSIYYLDSEQPLLLEGWLSPDGEELELLPGPNLVLSSLDGLSVMFERMEDGYDIPLMLVDDPSLSYLLCPEGNQNIASASSAECTGDDPDPDCPDLGDLPVDADVSCDDDGRTLTVTVRVENRISACESFTSITDYVWSLEEDEPLPADWPC